MQSLIHTREFIQRNAPRGMFCIFSPSLFSVSLCPAVISSNTKLMGEVLSCCRKSGKQDCKGSRIKKLLKTALKRPKIIVLTGLTFALKAAYIPLFLKLERGGRGRGQEHCNVDRRAAAFRPPAQLGTNRQNVITLYTFWRHEFDRDDFSSSYCEITANPPLRL
jgi:hypothetical protein